jgi:hypothetical protein
MTNRHLILFAFIILFLALTQESMGRLDPQDRKGGGPEALYNPETVVTVAGIVVSITPPVQSRLPYLVYLTLETKERKINVYLGPSLYVDNLVGQIKALDMVQVTGSKINWEGSPVILAAEVKKDNKVIKLRDPNGVPIWSRPR